MGSFSVVWQTSSSISSVRLSFSKVLGISHRELFTPLSDPTSDRIGDSLTIVRAMDLCATGPDLGQVLPVWVTGRLGVGSEEKAMELKAGDGASPARG